MSIWTHVSGLIRFDSLRLKNNDSPSEWIGPMDLWDMPDDKSTIPAGSEGSLEYLVIENPSASALAAYTVPIWGDLRDFDRIQVIIDWLTLITKDRWVRDGIVHIEVEGGASVCLVYENSNWQTITQ